MKLLSVIPTTFSISILLSTLSRTSSKVNPWNPIWARCILSYKSLKLFFHTLIPKPLMVLTLFGLKPEFETVHHQILIGSTKPIMKDTPEFELVHHQILTGSTNPIMKDTYKWLLNMVSNSSSTVAFTGTPPKASTLA